MSYLPYALASQLSLFMKEQNLTVFTLAEKAGVSSSTVRKALKGGNIRLDTLTLLALALGTEPMELVSARALPRFERFTMEVITNLRQGTLKEVSPQALRRLLREANSLEEAEDWLLWFRILMAPKSGRASGAKVKKPDCRRSSQPE